MNLNGYDEWKLSSGQDDEKIIGYCKVCGGEIYSKFECNDKHEKIHEDCFDVFKRRLILR